MKKMKSLKGGLAESYLQPDYWQHRVLPINHRRQ